MLALLALAIQLVLSFGHFHADGLAHATPLTATSGQTAASIPAGPASNRDNPAADACAICATVAMAGTVLAATPPAPALPVAFIVAPAPRARDIDLARASGAAFRSRAPPRS
ncbi:DUF2946 family protein [Bradyrhizobium sp. 2TAF24]|uniref:DUF2946 family protein n=1 Tax=Bradyrhizobium sp. 2TAF24 TaxID=3233011 RepID=UPI003F926D86